MEFKNKSKMTEKMEEDMLNSLHGLKGINDTVTIFGSARLRKGDEHYDNCVKLSRALADNNISVMTGGGPGIMEAGNKGAFESENKDSKSIAIGIKLPNEQGLNDFADIKLTHEYFSTRKIQLTKHSNIGFVAFAGGVGTLDEISEIACLINTKKLISSPIILIDKNYYKGLIDWMKDVMVYKNCITEDEIDECFVLVDTWQEAAKILIDKKNNK